MEAFTGILTIAGIIVIALIAMGFILARLYKKSTKEIAFVRTGFRGQKVVLNGGALVLPVLHDVIPVNMNTLRLEVQRKSEEALITKDRMRVDVAVEFYVRVKALVETIANAAQTLGRKTMNPSELKDLVEGKFVDALRAVAAEMSMAELHEQRVDFVNKVQLSVSEDLLKNGLELESVSLTGLDQTGKEFFNPDNAFDAEGLTKLTQEIEERRKIRNDIEQDTEVAIRTKDLEAKQQKLEIARETEYAQLKQEREIEIRRANQTTEIAQERALKKREADQAEIDAKRQVDLSRINAEREVEQEDIEKQRLLQEKEIEKKKTVETAAIEQEKAVELSAQGKAIAIAEKSKEQSVAQAEADKARAEAVREEERVVTVRDTEKAERIKAVELVEARKHAERDAIAIELAAEAEKNAALDQAESVKTLANAEAEKNRIEAKGHAEAEILAAEAAAKRYDVDAEGEKALNEAHNLLSVDQIKMQIKIELIKSMPEIIKQSVKPMEQIDGIKIIQVDGLNTGTVNTGSSEGGDGKGGSLADQLVNSALRYRGQAPLVDSLLSEIGLKGGDINMFDDPQTPAE